MNAFLKPRTNWKNLCFIFSLVFFITGIFVGKSFADGTNNAQVISGNGPLVYNVDDNPVINSNFKAEQIQPATPLIPNRNTMDFVASASLTDGGNTVLPNGAYSTLPLQYYNLVINYSSPVKGFAKFVIQYNINGIAQTKEVSYPIQEGTNTLTIPNWLLKGTYNTQGIPINYSIDNLQVIKSQVVFN